MNRKRLFFPALVCLFIILLSACSTDNRSVYRQSKALMDTYVTVTVVSDSKGKAEKGIEDAFSAIDRFGDLINFFSEKSELSEINRNAGIAPVKVSALTLDVVEKSLYVADKSDGAFDPTIGPEISMWDFPKKIKPSDDDIRRNLPLVNYRNVAVDKKKSTVFLKKKGMMMDLGGIAKGYGADLAVEALKRDGIKDGIVAVAGDIRTFGLKPDGSPWNVGIENPRQKDASDEIMATVRLSDKAISTSGDYQRYFISGGRRYHHLLDPETGYPAMLCRSASVITDKGVFTDAFATAVFVLGPEKGMKVLRELGMDGVIIDAAGNIYTTPGLKGKLTIEKDH
jgi:FAD:protein FMN transferase